MNRRAFNIAGKTILLTGVPGFVGMAVLERLLREQYNALDTVYVLVRGSGDTPPSQRLEKTLRSPLFDVLRATYPSFGTKVVAVEGDISKSQLGLSSEDMARLACSVESIVHCADSAESSLPLKEAFNVNTMGVVRLLKLAGKCTKLLGIVHVSTAYVNCNLKNITIEEKVYPMTIGDPTYLVKNIPAVDETALASLEQCVLQEYPNTYTFTKALVEHVVAAKSSRWNIAIVRPSIVVSASSSPTAGWIHGNTAVTGIATLIGQGFIDCMPVEADHVVDFVPVDHVAGIVVGALEVVNAQPGCHVYHATSSTVNPLTFEMFRAGLIRGWEKQPPLDKSIARPSLEFAPDLAEFQQRLRATRHRILSGSFMKMARQDPVGAKKVLTLAMRFEATYKSLLFFGLNQFFFKSHNALAFRTTLATMDWTEYLANFTAGIRHFVIEKHPSRVIQEPAPHTEGTYPEA